MLLRVATQSGLWLIFADSDWLLPGCVGPIIARPCCPSTQGSDYKSEKVPSYRACPLKYPTDPGILTGLNMQFTLATVILASATLVSAKLPGLDAIAENEEVKKEVMNFAIEYSKHSPGLCELVGKWDMKGPINLDNFSDESVRFMSRDLVPGLLIMAASDPATFEKKQAAIKDALCKETYATVMLPFFPVAHPLRQMCYGNTPQMGPEQYMKYLIENVPAFKTLIKGLAHGKATPTTSVEAEWYSDAEIVSMCSDYLVCAAFTAIVNPANLSKRKAILQKTICPKPFMWIMYRYHPNDKQWRDVCSVSSADSPEKSEVFVKVAKDTTNANKIQNYMGEFANIQKSLFQAAKKVAVNTKEQENSAVSILFSKWTPVVAAVMGFIIL